MVSKLLQDQRLCIALTLGSGIYFLTYLCGFSLLECPSQSLFNKPCPGCGLTRSVATLANGNIQESIKLHALAIPYIALFSLIGLAAILPQQLRSQLIALVARSEQLTHWPSILAIVTIVYGLTRLIPTG